MGVLSLILASGLLFCATLAAQGSPELSIPATFKFDLTLPGDGNNFLRPARIFTDHTFHEVYVCDPGNARILIFNEQGIFKYEFSVTEYMGSPRDLVVTSEGYIVVLGSTRDGMRLFKFDYDGLYLGDFAADAATIETLAGTSSITIDGHDRVYALVQSTATVMRLTPEGRIDKRFAVEPEATEAEFRDMVTGSISFLGDYLYIPLSSFGSVNRYTADGRLVGRLGIKGTLVGQMNFPVSVSMTSDGIIMVLDKHRFNVICYNEKGQFLAEFGGKGISNGWFYHPSWIAVDASDQIYVGQIFHNRIQVLSIPDLVYKRKAEVAGQAAEPPKTNGEIGYLNINPDLSRRCFGKSNSAIFDCVEDDIPHTTKNVINRIPNNPLSLTFTESVGGIYNA